MTVVFAMPAARRGSLGGDLTYLTIAKLLPRPVGKVNARLSMATAESTGSRNAS